MLEELCVNQPYMFGFDVFFGFRKNVHFLCQPFLGMRLIGYTVKIDLVSRVKSAGKLEDLI